MNRELLILLYKINVRGLSRAKVAEIFQEARFALNIDDEEIAKKYIVKQIFIPVQDGDSDVQVIFPVAAAPRIDELSKELIEKGIENGTLSDDEFWTNILNTVI